MFLATITKPRNNFEVKQVLKSFSYPRMILFQV